MLEMLGDAEGLLLVPHPAQLALGPHCHAIEGEADRRGSLLVVLEAAVRDARLVGARARLTQAHSGPDRLSQAHSGPDRLSQAHPAQDATVLGEGCAGACDRASLG